MLKFLLYLFLSVVVKCVLGSSLSFVFDTTGSMHDDLEQLREGAGRILDAALEGGGVENFVFVPFHDPRVGPVTVTTDKQTFKAALDSVRVYGGGDCPEKSVTGISLALNASMPGSFVYVFTDATAKDHRLTTEVLDIVQRKQSQVVFILTGHCNDLHKPHYKAYTQIAAASSGQVFNLNKTSVHKVLDFVKSSIKGRKVNLGSLVYPAGYNHTHGFPVDKSLNEVTVSVSGSRPSIRVLDPSGAEVNPPKLETTLDLSEIMVVKVHDPQPGNWSITVGGGAQHSVRIVGLSNLTFHMGFSVEKPETMEMTSHRPLQGTLNYMLISLTESRPVSLKSVEILNLEGKVIFEVPLKNVNNKDYLAEAFLPPEDFFYVAIKGFDEDEHELRRVAPTAVKAKLPDAPYIVIEKQIELRAHRRAALVCKVESLVPISGEWAREGTRLMQPVTSLQSTVIEYVIDDVTEAYAGTYKCSASNVAGVTRAYTEVTVLVDPPVINMSHGNLTMMIGEEVNIPCKVFSEALLKEFKFLYNGSEYRYETDTPFKVEDSYYYFENTIKINENDTGMYTCSARNSGGSTSKSIYIEVLSYPIVKITGSKVIQTNFNSTIIFTCKIENALKAYWISPNKTFVGIKEGNGNFDNDLKMYNVKLNDSGIWTCVGERNDFTEQDMLTVEVTMKPQISIEGPKDVTIIYGSGKDISCGVVANPAADVYWRKSNGERLDTKTTQADNYKYKSYLSLNNVTEENEDKYSCYAENTQGSSVESIQIKVWKPIIVVESLIDQSIELYSQVELPCVLDAYPRPTIVWFHNGTELRTNRNVHKSSDNTTVYINKVEFDNFGLYQCKAGNGYENITLNGTLSVCCLEAPVLSKGEPKNHVQQGRFLTLSTSIQKGNPPPNIQWQYITNNYSTELPDGLSISDDGLELTISMVEKKHEGVYRCVAENIVGRDDYEIQVVVLYPPKLIINKTKHDPLEIESGKKVTFTCEVSGTPKPLVTWTKDEEPLAYSKNVYLSNDSLVIDVASEHDSGEFTCNATNSVGFTVKNYTLIVFERPSISSSIDPHIEVLEGQRVELPCFARGLPSPKVEWQQNGNTVKTERMYVDDVFFLRFVANLTDFGEYTCTATNPYGNSSMTYEVFVWVPPALEPQDTVKDVISGENVTFECNAVGFPIPEVSWAFQDLKILDSNTDNNLSFSSTGNLYIVNATVKNEGPYTCAAENIAGVSKTTTYLRVNEPPQILPEPFTGPYLASDLDTELMLPCRAVGKPKPFIVWAKDGLFIDKDFRYNITSEGTLVLSSLSEQLNGFYTCVAKNIVGEVNRTVEVRIYSLPLMTQADQTSKTVTLLEGSNETLQCPIQSTQGDTVKWYKNAELVATGDLNLINATESTYACVVTNAMGSWQTSVDIEVEYVPAFLDIAQTTKKVVSGDDIFLDCGVRAKPKAQIKWYFNSKLLPWQEEDHYKQTNIQVHHTGMYRCVARNIHGSAERLYSVDVLVPPFISEFDFLDVQLKEGTNATLDCKARGSPEPSVKWVYNNTHWHQTNQSLHTANTTGQSEGTFKCVALNEAGHASLVYRVTVVAPAQVDSVIVFENGEGTTVVGTSVEIEINKTIRISCHATGNPIPNIRWISNGNTLSENEDGIAYADLTFEGRNFVTAGYSCTASNEGGTDFRNIEVEVLEPPRISTSLFDNSMSQEASREMEVLSGQKFYLHCHPYGNPVPQVYWFKEETPLKLYDDTMVTTDFGEIVVSNSASSGQSGNYTCVARNKVGNSSFSYLVDVLVPPPSSKSSLTDIRIRHGTPLKLTCPADGTPLPDAVWVKHPYLELSEKLSDRIRLEDRNYTLIINNTISTDSGEYSCHLSNKVGNTQISFNVSIEKAPSIVGGDSNHTVYVGDNVALYCDCDGEPRPTVKWYKDAKPLKQSNTESALGGRLLTLHRVESRDATQFVCVAENAAGLAYKRFYLHVKVPGKWTPWSQWSFCDATCGVGHQGRSRSCRYTDDYVTIDKTLNKTAANVILDESGCKGNAIDKRKCHMPPCEDEESMWSTWSAWAPCSSSCGVGSQTRTRVCEGDCHGDNLQIRKCPHLPSCDSTNDVFNSREEVTEPDPYAPEAEYDLEPEPYPEYPPDVEEFYVETADKNPRAQFEVKVTENLDRSERGACGAGFRYNNDTGGCEDIDECTIEKNQCHSTQSCVNSAGGYRCGCPRGYAALGAGQRCLDINECILDARRCEFACVNTAGGYVCACPAHLRLHSDRHHCVAASGRYKGSKSKDKLTASRFSKIPKFRT